MNRDRAKWILNNCDHEGLFPVKPLIGLGYPNRKGINLSELSYLLEHTKYLNSTIPLEKRDTIYYSIESSLQVLSGSNSIKFYEIVSIENEIIENIGYHENFFDDCLNLKSA